MKLWHESGALKCGIEVWHGIVAFVITVGSGISIMSANQFLGKYENVFLSGENVLFGKRKLEMCTKKGKKLPFSFPFVLAFVCALVLFVFPSRR